MKILPASSGLAFKGIPLKERTKPHDYRNALGQRIVKYNTPVSLEKVLKDLKEDNSYKLGIVSEKSVLKNFLENLKQTAGILKTEIVKMAGYGNRAIAFETTDGKKYTIEEAEKKLGAFLKGRV